MQQLALAFEPGLAERHGSLLACVRECVYRSQRPLKSIAADMDMSESTLTRKLSGNPDDPRHFSIDDLERYISTQGDLTPLHYLAEKYAIDINVKQAHAAAEMARLLPQVLALAKALEITAPATKGKR